MNFYNENDPKAAAWLRELIKAGELPDGTVCEKSITDLTSIDLDGFTQYHFFAGIGGWSVALKLAGWPEDRPVWTGSCPCQPFSCAGKGLREADERHLWPYMRNLAAECRPPTIFGEQVASEDGREWLSRVRADLEAMGYAVGGSDLCAASVQAPQKRQRLYWVAHSTRQQADTANTQRLHAEPCGCGVASGLGISDSSGRDSRLSTEPGTRYGYSIEPTGSTCGMGALHNQGSQGRGRPLNIDEKERREDPQRHGGTAGFWSDFDIAHFANGESRRIESGTFPLVASLPRGVVPSGDPSISEAQSSGESRVARLRGYGNSIVPPLAAEFISASMETLNETMH